MKTDNTRETNIIDKKQLYLKIGAVIAALAVALCISYVLDESNGSDAKDSSCMEECTWELSDDGVLTIYGSGAISDYTAGSAPWYEYRELIKSVDICTGITSVGNYDFYDCTNLESVSFPDTLESIGQRSFWFCGSLQDVSFPDSLKTIGKEAFCSTGVASVILGDGVESIGESAFKNCTSLVTVSIGTSVRIIDNNPFCNCPNLYTFTISADNMNYSVDSETGALCTHDGKTLVAYPGGKACGKFLLPDTVVNIGSYSLSYLTSKCSVTISDNITTISQSAFYYSTGLQMVSFSKSSNLSFIGNYAFMNCNSLFAIDLPGTLLIIGQHAFDSCTSLTKVYIPDSVTVIGAFAFSNCDKIMCISFGSGLVQANDIGLRLYDENIEELKISADTIKGQRFCAGLDGKLIIVDHEDGEAVESVE